MASEADLVAFAFHLLLAAFSAYAGILLLRLRPESRARTFLALSMCAAPLPAFYAMRVLAPGPLNPLWSLLLVLGVGAAWILGVLFVATFPSPIQWRSPIGVIFAAALGFGAATTALDGASALGATIQTPEWFDFGAYSWQRSAILTLLIIHSLIRSRGLADGPRRTAVRVLVAYAAGTCVFAGYSIVQLSNALLHGPMDDHLARYQLLAAGNYTAYELFVRGVAAPIATGGLFVVFAVARRDGLAWGLALLGGSAYVMDQFSRKDIIDIGVLALLTPAILLRESIRHGALGVQKVPARLALPVAFAAGLAVLAAILSVTSLVAGDQPLLIAIGLVVAVGAGAALTYSLRPRGVQISLTRVGAPPRSPISLEAGALVADRYQLKRHLGSGGEGAAWLATDRMLQRRVVLKAIRPEGAREARLGASVRHPGVVTIYDVVETVGATFIVIEYAEEGDLRGLLSRRGKLSAREADEMLDAILRALEAVHAQGICHGDLKPENILLTASGAPKLADFGLARAPTSGTIVAGAGTLAYMSPEQARGEPAGAQSDLWAAALLYSEMLTGAHPHAGLDDIMLRPLVSRGPVPHGVSGARGRFLDRALAASPTERFASAAAMREALAAIAAEERADKENASRPADRQADDRQS